ncbi:MAG: hypothetical protein ACREGG_03990 [Candidatus Saccharimonadales bacterium]
MEDEPTKQPIEGIPFNPDNVAAGNKQVVIDGEEKTVHFTNNFWTKFASYNRLEARGEEPQSGIDKAYKEEFDRVHLHEILETFRQQYPGLYQKLEEITDRWAEIQLQRQQEIEQARVQYGDDSPEYRGAVNQLPYEPRLMAEKDYYFSMAYDGVVPIAKNTDPDFDLNFFIA